MKIFFLVFEILLKFFVSHMKCKKIAEFSFKKRSTLICMQIYPNNYKLYLIISQNVLRCAALGKTIFLKLSKNLVFI